MFRFITRRPLWVNILAGIIIIVVIMLLLVWSLNWLTHHGESRTVPALNRKKLEDVKKLLADKGFDYVIQDSVYYDSLPPGIVIKQVPEADEIVKAARTVYITINRFVTPDIEMPNLIGFSFRNAEFTLKNAGLKLGDTTFRPDFATNSVLEMLYNGRSIRPGDKIKMGSRISLVLASGVGNVEMAVPDLKGLTIAQAKAFLDGQGLTYTIIVDPDVTDTLNAYVRDQRPKPKTEDGLQIRIRTGQMIDIFAGRESPVTDSTAVLPPVQEPPNEP